MCVCAYLSLSLSLCHTLSLSLSLYIYIYTHTRPCLYIAAYICIAKRAEEKQQTENRGR